MKKSIVRVALKKTQVYLIMLVILSMIIAYLTIFISINIKYAIDGIIFNDYTAIPVFLNNILQNNYIYDLLIIASIIIVLNFLEKMFKYLRDRLTTKLKLKININLKSALYEHILKLEYESYNSYDKAEIIQRINEDADVYSKFFNSQFNLILDIIFLSIFIIRESTVLNITISIYIFLSIVIMLFFSLWYFKKLGIYIGRMISKKKRLLNATIENINNYKFIRMFNKQNEEKANYKNLNDDYSDEEVKFIKLVLFFDIILEHLTYLKSPIIYMLGGIAIIKRTNDTWSTNSFTYLD